MPAFAIRYRRNGPGPATYLVEIDERLYVYAHGVLGAALPESPRVTAEVAKGFGWVPVKDNLVVDVPMKAQAQAQAQARRSDDRRESVASTSERVGTVAAPPTFGELGEAFFA